MRKKLKMLFWNCKFRFVIGLLASLLLTCDFKMFTVFAVDPGWERESTVESKSESSVSESDRSEESSSSASMISESSDDSNHSQTSGDNIVEESSIDSSQPSTSDSSSLSSVDSKIDSKISSSVSSSSSSVKVYTKAELLDHLETLYKSKLDEMNDANKNRILENNNKGASELLSTYKKTLKNIKSGKVTKQERAKLINSQKASLQKVLSARLNSLYESYNRDVESIKNDLESIDNNHENNSKVVELSSRLAMLDHKLSEDSKKAYEHYDKELHELNKSVDRQPVKSKKQQRLEAKNSYNANLKAVDAIDPNTLKIQNESRLNLVTEKYKHLKSLIEDGAIKNVSSIDKEFVVN